MSSDCSMNAVTIDTTRKPREGEKNGRGEYIIVIGMNWGR